MWRICAAASLVATHALPVTSPLGQFEIEPSGLLTALQDGTYLPLPEPLAAPGSLSQTHRSTNFADSNVTSNVTSNEIINATSSVIINATSNGTSNATSNVIVNAASDATSNATINATINAAQGMVGEVKASGSVSSVPVRNHNMTDRLSPVRMQADPSFEPDGWREQAVHAKASVELTKELVKRGPDESVTDWLVLASFTLVLVVADCLILQAMPTGFYSRMICIIFWVGSGMCFSVYIWAKHGGGYAALWLNGYYLEYVMSFDNLLIFAQVFRAFRTPEQDMHKALFVGVWSCIIFRLIFFVTIGPALNAFGWVHYVLGVVLGISALATLFEDDDTEDDLQAIQNTYTVRFLRWTLGGFLHEDYDREGHRLFIFVNGKLRATVLMLVVLALELMDLLLALDTTSIKVVILPSVFAAYSSTLMACLGLRSLFFVLQYSVEQFALLNYGIVVSLMFVAVTLLFEDIITLERWVICVVITTILVFSAVLSTLPTFRESPKTTGEDSADEVPEAKTKDDSASEDFPARQEEKKLADVQAS